MCDKVVWWGNGEESDKQNIMFWTPRREKERKDERRKDATGERRADLVVLGVSSLALQHFQLAKLLPCLQ
jgi:hypothetical protein